MADRVAGDSVDARRDVNLIDTVGLVQRACSDLARACFFTWRSGGKGEDTSGAYPQNAADNSLVAHANTYKVCHVASPFEEMHHRDVVGETLGCRDNLDEFGLVGANAFENAVKVFSSSEVVVRNDESSPPRAELFQLSGLDGFRGLELDIDHMEARGSGLLQNLQLVGDRRFEFASSGNPAAGGDGGYLAAFCEECLKLRQRSQWFLQIVEAKFQERVFACCRFSFFNHFCRGRPDDGHTDLSDTRPEVLRRECLSNMIHESNCGILPTVPAVCNSRPDEIVRQRVTDYHLDQNRLL